MDLANLPAGYYLRIDVSNIGAGMTPEVQVQIFDPFFTTKFPGRGRGLGLAVTDGIVCNHGGAIQVSTSQQGTTFRVWLPCTATTSQAAGSPITPLNARKSCRERS